MKTPLSGKIHKLTLFIELQMFFFNVASKCLGAIVQTKMCIERSSSKSGKNCYLVSSKPVEIERCLAILSLSPELSSDPEAKWPSRWFNYAIFAQLVNIFRAFISAFADVSSDWTYYIGDMTLIFGIARDYAGYMALILSAASCLTLLHIRLMMKRGEIEFFHEIRRFDSGKVELRSLDELAIFQRMHKTLCIVKRISLNLSIISGAIMALIYFPALHIFRSIEYIIFLGVPWIPIHVMLIFVPSTIGIGLMSLFGAFCYQIILKIDLFRRKAVGLMDKGFDDVAELCVEYHDLRIYIFNQNKFWKQAMGTPFIGWLFGSCFCCYVLFFIPMNIILKSAIGFWGIIAFTIILPGLAAAHVNKKFFDLRKAIERLIRNNMFLQDKLRVINMLEDIVETNPLTCHDLFTFDYMILVKALIELGSHLILLVTLKITQGVVIKNSLA